MAVHDDADGSIALLFDPDNMVPILLENDVDRGGADFPAIDKYRGACEIAGHGDSLGPSLGDRQAVLKDQNADDGDQEYGHRPAARASGPLRCDNYPANLNIAIDTATTHMTINTTSQTLKKALLPLPSSRPVIAFLVYWPL
jgi:hypothetical protein